VTVLVLSQIFPPLQGGSGRWLWELYRRLHDVDVHVVADDAPGAVVFDRASGVPTVRIPLSFPHWGVYHIGGAIRYVRAFAALVSIIARVRPDSIHCGKCLPEGLLATALWRWTRVPFRCFVHGEELTLAATSRELAHLTRIVLNRASGLIANSRHTKEMLVRQWQVPEDRVAVLHPGVDTTRFVPARNDAASRARLGWTNRRVVLTVGALQKRKGQDMMIRALPAIRARCPDVLYAIVGEGWERPYLDQLVAEHGVGDIVQFRGVPGDAELIDCYQQCDLFALPNRQVGWDFEGFGIVLLEAQACGQAVVAGLSGGTSETLDPASTGELVNCDSPEPLAAVVSDLLNDPARRARMGASARKWAVEHFDWQALSRQALQIMVP
jgi:phosphatidylinositol alpha-1,6-mannosyltransferase